MKDEWLKYCDLWYQMLQKGQEDRDINFLWTYSIDKMTVNVRESCFSGMVFTVSRLMRIVLNAKKVHCTSAVSSDQLITVGRNSEESHTETVFGHMLAWHLVIWTIHNSWWVCCVSKFPKKTLGAYTSPICLEAIVRGFGVSPSLADVINSTMLNFVVIGSIATRTIGNLW